VIYVKRSRVARPAVLDGLGSPAARERAAAAEFFDMPERTRGQRRFAFEVYRDKSVIAALTDLFHGKCAYCEARVATTIPMDVEQFRPKSGVSERPEHPGYWWLAATWENLLVSCADCSRARIIEGVKRGKANRFPLVEESQRAFLPGEETRESPLLLDPCFDHPEEHLVFDEQGGVASDTVRGQTTIAVLGLNRPGLVEARLHAVLQVKSVSLRTEFFAFERTTAASPDVSAQIDSNLRKLKAMTEASEEFVALKRQLIKPVLDLFGKAEADKFAGSWDAAAPTITRARIKQAQESFRAFEQSQSDFSLTSKEGREIFRLQRRQIEHVSIRNFKAIGSLRLDLRSGSGRTGWLMLLGENGTGKSSILQAIALTLAGADYFSTLTVERGLMLRELIHSRARQAKISVKLSGFIGPHELTLTANHATYRKPNGDEAHVYVGRGKARVKARTARSAETQSVVLAYGATRLLPHRNTVRYGIEYARVDNLFNPFLPLFDAETWLMGLDWRAFNSVAIVLKDLLALDQDAELTREKGRMLVRAHGAKVPIKQLSDGYQAMVAMSVDILEVAMRLWPRLQDAEGIVLLDEIGSHLHPTWKMRIVGSLRRAFPGMQFVATTHDPLCLRGLGEGEVVVLQRDESEGIVSVTGLPSPSDFRIDQLLTSEFFGLNSTTDVEVENLFDEYYALLALGQRSPDQETRLSALREDLKDRRYLGNTLREQLMFEAVDQLIARQKRVERRSIPELKSEAVEEISRIWNEKT
jgi:uncharacterized protein (TIGR02646 family)